MKLYKSNLSDSILNICEKYSDEILIDSIDGKKMTGNEYRLLALDYSSRLIDKGVRPGDNVVIFIGDLTKFSAIALAVILVGAKLVIIEPDMGELVFEDKLKFIKPDLVIIDKLLYRLLKSPLRNIKKIKKFNNLLKYSKKVIIESKNISKIYKKHNIEYVNQNVSNEVLVVFTGGTTGNPKGVVHTLESLQIMFDRIKLIIGDNTKIFYADLPHFVLIGISLGAKVIAGKNELNDNKFLKILNKYKVDTTFSPPYRYINILNSKKYISDNLKHILLGSAPIYKSFLNKLYAGIGKNTKVTCIYGMTEMLPVSYIDGKEKLRQDIDGDLLGKIFSDINVNILDDGELEVFGRGLFKNYLGGNKIYKHKTGDLVNLEKRNLIMKSRKKDMILRKDYNIYPSLYEGIINSIGGIKNSALVGVWDEDLQDEKVVLFIECNYLNKKDILGKLKVGKYSIDKFALPDKIIFCNIPRKGRQNKIDKNYLRDNYKKYENSNNMI